jgi:hypothetical protein
MSVERIDRSAMAVARARDAGAKAMDAASAHLTNEVKKAFGSDYYKGGAFRSTLQVKQSIRRVGPTWAGTGWEAVVGTHIIEALYWELGHHNAFTRKYERRELWKPTALSQAEAMRTTFARVFARFMGTAA